MSFNFIFRSSFILIIHFFLKTATYSQAPSVIFQKTIGGSLNEEAFSVIPTNDGGYLLGGWTNSDDGFVLRPPLKQGTPQDTYFIKLNSTFQKQWNYVPTTPSVSSGSDFGYAFLRTADNGFISVGNSANEDIVVVKVTDSGALDWEKKYSLQIAYNFEKNQIVQTQDGGYLIVGTNYAYIGSTKVKNLLILKISSNGTQEWTQSYGGSGDDYGNSITKTNDGNYVVAGITYSYDGDASGNHGGSDLLLLKINLSGSLIWKRVIGTSRNEDIKNICATSDGGIAACGSIYSYSPNPEQRDFLIYKINSNGDVEWNQMIGSAISDEAGAIIESNSGGFIVTGVVGNGVYEEVAQSGNASGLKGKGDVWLIKLGATGNLLWEKTLGGSQNDIAYFVKELNTGEILVAGATHSPDEDVSDYLGGGFDGIGGDMWLIKLGFNIKTINAQSFYAPNNTIKISSICPGGNLDLKVKLEGYNNQSNIFKIQMSDSNGNFINPITLSTINSPSNFTQNIVIPANTSYGNSYKIRVIDEVNNVVSYNSRTLIINSNLPTGEIYEGSASVVKGSTVTIKARFTGIAPWNFTISEGGVSTVISNNSNDPYFFNRIVNNSQSFTLSSISNQCGVGTTSGRADIRMTYGGLKVADVNHYIANVKLCDFKGNQLDNTSANQLGDYSNLPPLSLQMGVEYALKSSVYNNYYSGTTTSFKIYIDINKDTSFSANELIYSTSQNSTSSSNYFSGNVVIPTTAINGLTRLRIVTQSSQHSTFNDVEDYAINIFPSSSPTVTFGEIANNNTNIVCAGSSFNVDFKKYNIPLNDYTYQVHLSDKNGLFTNSILIGSGRNSPISITIPSNTEVGTNFRLKLSATENSLVNSIKCGTFSVNKSPTVTISLSSDTILLNGNLQLSAILTGGEPYSFNISGGVTTVPSTDVTAFSLNHYNTVTKPTDYQITSLSNTCGIGPNSNVATLKRVIKYCMPKFDFRLIRKFSLSQGNLDLVNYADIGDFYPDPLFNRNTVIVVKKGQQYDVKFSDLVYGNENVGIWLDSNQDSLFTPSEKIYQSAVNNVLFRTGTITISMTATTGLTRMRVRVSKYASGIIQEACSLPTNLFFTSEVYGTRDFGLLILDNNSTAVSLQENNLLKGCDNSVISMNLNINGITPNNINYRLELSDINGLWQNPLVVGTSTTNPINMTIPNNLSITGNYQLRLLSDAPNAYYFQNTRNLKYFNKMESMNSGLWNTQSIWSCGRLPQITDDVYINSGHVIKLENYNGNAKSIFLNGTLQYINGSVRVSN